MASANGTAATDGAEGGSGRKRQKRRMGPRARSGSGGGSPGGGCILSPGRRHVEVEALVQSFMKERVDMAVRRGRGRGRGPVRAVAVADMERKAGGAAAEGQDGEPADPALELEPPGRGAAANGQLPHAGSLRVDGGLRAVEENGIAVADAGGGPVLLSQSMGAVPRATNARPKTLTTHRSVRELASRHNSKYKSRYMSYEKMSESLMRVASKKSMGGESVKSDLSGGQQATIPAGGAGGAGGGAGGMPPLGLGTNLRIHIPGEEDWVQVEEEEDEEEGDGEDTPRRPRNTLSLQCSADAQSYILSKSGTIRISGFGEGIGPQGLRKTSVLMRDRVVFLGKLGQGASGVVYKALDLVELKLVAVKVIPVFDREKRRQLSRELSALYETLSKSTRRLVRGDSDGLNSEECREHIVSFFDAYSNVDEATVALMVEYMDGGSLQDIVDMGGCPFEPTLASMARQALKGLYFLHRCKQIHRDIKPANMLINRQGQVKLSDLGILKNMQEPDMPTPQSHSDSSTTGGGSMSGSDCQARSKGQGPPPLLEKTNTFVGTVTYMSPERLDGKEYSYASDIWSLGLSLLACALGKLPINTAGGYWSILHSVRDEPAPNLPNDGAVQWSDDFKEFLAQCLRKDPNDRPTCAQLLRHTFLQLHEPEEDAEPLDSEMALDDCAGMMKAVGKHITLMKQFAQQQQHQQQQQQQQQQKFAENEQKASRLLAQETMETPQRDGDRESGTGRFTTSQPSSSHTSFDENSSADGEYSTGMNGGGLPGGLRVVTESQKPPVRQQPGPQPQPQVQPQPRSEQPMIGSGIDMGRSVDTLDRESSLQHYDVPAAEIVDTVFNNAPAAKAKQLANQLHVSVEVLLAQARRLVRDLRENKLEAFDEAGERIDSRDLYENDSDNDYDYENDSTPVHRIRADSGQQADADHAPVAQAKGAPLIEARNSSAKYADADGFSGDDDFYDG